MFGGYDFEDLAWAIGRGLVELVVELICDWPCEMMGGKALVWFWVLDDACTLK